MAEDLSKEYRKERKRIQTELSRLRKQGYDITEINIGKIKKTDDEFTLRNEISLLKQISNEVIRQNTYKQNEGVYISRYEATQSKRKNKMSKENLINLYEQNWYLTIERFPNVAYPYLSQVTDNLVNQYGRETVFLGINNALKDGYIITYEQAYDEESLYEYAKGLVAYFEYDPAEFEDLFEALNTDDIFAEMFL